MLNDKGSMFLRRVFYNWKPFRPIHTKVVCIISEITVALKKIYSMHTSITKKLGSLFILSTVLLSFVTPIKHQSNFSGTWALNEGKSELGQYGTRGADSKLEVTQATDAITINRTSNSLTGETVTAAETLTADGKESESTFLGTSKKKSTIKWAADGNSFTITFVIAFEMNGQSFDLSGTQTWAMSEDGKTLSLSTALVTPQGDITTKAVYDKQ